MAANESIREKACQTDGHLAIQYKYLIFIWRMRASKFVQFVKKMVDHHPVREEFGLSMFSV